MTFADVDMVSVLLRATTYAGTVAAAGGVLFSLTIGQTHDARVVRAQAVFGAALLLIAEPLRYGLFQLSIAQGDVALAFGPDMRWLGMETPMGQAVLIRLAGLGLVLLGLVFSASVATVGALTVIGSFLIEGHTASSGSRYFLGPLVFLHLLAIHWWLGALWPLRVALGRPDIPSREIADCVERFGRQALLAVGGLVVTGAFLLAFLVGWQFDLSSPYQQGFLIKLCAFSIILIIAATNKLRLTPLLISHPERGRSALRRLISAEIVVALGILVATAFAISFPPTGH